MGEALQDSNERVAFQYKSGIPDSALGSQAALLKVQASKTMEFCAREASQIFGGSSIVKEGLGKVVERVYREVRAIPSLVALKRSCSTWQHARLLQAQRSTASYS